MIIIDEGEALEYFCSECVINGDDDCEHENCKGRIDFVQALEASRLRVEGLEEWESELKSMLNGMTFPDQIVSHVKALLKAEREKVCGEIEVAVRKSWLKGIDKIAEIRGRG